MADVLSSLYMYICIHLYTYFQIFNINLSEKQRSYFIFLSSLKFLLYYIKFEGKGEGGGRVAFTHSLLSGVEIS